MITLCFTMLCIYSFICVVTAQSPYNIRGNITCGSTVSGVAEGTFQDDGSHFVVTALSQNITFTTCGSTIDTTLKYYYKQNSSWYLHSGYCIHDHTEDHSASIIGDCQSCGLGEIWTITLSTGQYYVGVSHSTMLGFGGNYTLSMICNPITIPQPTVYPTDIIIQSTSSNPTNAITSQPSVHPTNTIIETSHLIQSSTSITDTANRTKRITSQPSVHPTDIIMNSSHLIQYSTTNDSINTTTADIVSSTMSSNQAMSTIADRTISTQSTLISSNVSRYYSTTLDGDLESNEANVWWIVILCVLFCCLILCAFASIYKVEKSRKKKELEEIIGNMTVTKASADNTNSDELNSGYSDDIVNCVMNDETVIIGETTTIEGHQITKNEVELTSIQNDGITSGNIDKLCINDGIIWVRNWLEEEVKYPQYVSNFIVNGYDTMDIITEIKDKSFLEEIGIKSKEHQMHILKEINMIQSTCDEGVTTNNGDIVIYYEPGQQKMTIQ